MARVSKIHVLLNILPLRLATEAVQGSALSLECIDHIEGGYSLSFGVFGICNCISDDGLEEGFEDTTGFFVNHGRNTLDTTTASETSDSWLGDTLDVVSKNLVKS